MSGGCPAGSSCTGIITADPLLGPLGNYGGATQTIPLLPGSSAIDATSSNCPPTDQRSIARPQGAACDIGAYESRGFTLVTSGGDSQTSVARTPFATPLSVTLSETAGSPLQGASITFSAPSSGASLSTASFSVTTNASGVASSPVTANSAIGSYSVTAAASSTGPNQLFSLANRGYLLGVSITGEDGNKVESTNPDQQIICIKGSASSCSGEYLPGTMVTLDPVPLWKSQFANWSPNVVANVVTMDGDKTVTATFDPFNRVRLVPVSGTPSDYNTLQGAYDQAADGDTILAQGYAFPEVLPEIGKVLTFKGGYDGIFSDDPGMTTVTGPFRVKGSVIAERLVVKAP